MKCSANPDDFNLHLLGEVERIANSAHLGLNISHQIFVTSCTELLFYMD